MPRPKFTLIQTLQTAKQNFPSIRAAEHRVEAASADIALAKTAYLPRFDLIAQEMVSTANIVQGAILPQAIDVLPTQTGKEAPTNSMRGRLGNNFGANFSWLLADFGLRKANVELSRSKTNLAGANLKLTELDVLYNAADNYLLTVENLQVIRAAQLTVERMQTASLTAHSLVDAGLRAGVDAALADYELSQARIKLIEAERAAELSRVDLAESMGLAGSYIEVVSRPLTEAPGMAFRVPAAVPGRHPLLQARKAAVKTESAKVQVQEKAYRPHLWLQSAVWGRGSGVRGVQQPLAAGFMPQVANYVAGLSLSFPTLDIFEIRARKRHAKADELAERANYDLAMQILEQKDARARVMLADARRIAAETPIMVRAARENQIKTLERYSVGLTDMVAVAQAERMLASAEVENNIAQVEVWRAILAAAYVQGDFSPFINLVASAERRE